MAIIKMKEILKKEENREQIKVENVINDANNKIRKK